MRRESVVSVLILLLLWQVICSVGIIRPLFLPPPGEVAQSLWQGLREREIWLSIGSTLQKVLVALVISIVSGVPLGLGMGQVKWFRDSLDFLVDFSRSLPAVALFPVFLLFFGLGATSQVATSIFACIMVVIVNTVYGVTAVPEVKIRTIKLFKAKWWEVYRLVILPSALPSIIAGIRVAASLAVVVIIVTEMFGGSEGLGQKLYQAQLSFRTARLYALIIVIGLIGWLVNRALVLLQDRYVHWVGR